MTLIRMRVQIVFLTYLCPHQLIPVLCVPSLGDHFRQPKKELHNELIEKNAYLYSGWYVCRVINSKYEINCPPYTNADLWSLSFSYLSKTAYKLQVVCSKKKSLIHLFLRFELSSKCGKLSQQMLISLRMEMKMEKKERSRDEHSFQIHESIRALNEHLHD